ncbi:hydroxyethylthiazole kinase [Corynebacterium poyangense]|uniref:Hydroxyethylthiazole kinase n=1 Tax=Corynebacterium poyangense TaxID=2684405 RepID=A0A7H0SNS8_9CORY|nr:hydroxyethylthiazole kinase [Corynebacterium poyangense]QNQ90203.1 hydroxyethylthiazole kinase [Corynebacterium poyangense]
MTQPALSEAFHALQSTSPLVQCLTNKVVAEITANVLLAVGAAPAMCDTPEESEGFAEVASGVLINAGTPSAEQYQGMRAAIKGASKSNTPWVLDPVAVGGLTHRTRFCQEIVQRHPTAIRGNASEISALAGMGSGGRGVDATDEVTSALDVARHLAQAHNCVVAVSGPQDLIVSADRITWLTSGDPLMQRLIGTGCSLGAVCAAYLGAAADQKISAHDAVLAAHAHLGAAGSHAAASSSGPGSFHAAWIDALYNLTDQDIFHAIEIQEEHHNA